MKDLSSVLKEKEKHVLTLIVALLMVTVGSANAQTLTAVDDSLATGPLQSISKDITLNDVIPCNNATMVVGTISTTSGTQELADGTLVREGNKITFTPKASARNKEVKIPYSISCFGGTSSANIVININNYDFPANIVHPTSDCWEYVPNGLDFTPTEKYHTDESNYLDGFSMPMVGDINGDGKPEIVALGLGLHGDVTKGSNLAGRAQYVHVFDGQTGERLWTIALGTGSDFATNVTILNHSGIYSTTEKSDDQFQLRYQPRHNSPAHIAIADLDGDGKTGEIIVAETGDKGRIYCLKPTLDADRKITGFTTLWYGNDNGTPYSSKYPITGDHEHYGAGIPYIADINADGKPEVIIYNKIFNGQTGQIECVLETLSEFTHPTSASSAQTCMDNYAFVGRIERLHDVDNFTPCMVIADMDGDGYLDIVAGSKVYLMKDDGGKPALKSIIKGPQSFTVKAGSSEAKDKTVYCADGFTSVGDVDGDGNLEVVVWNALDRSDDTHVAFYVWDPMHSPTTVKAALNMYINGWEGNISFPFIGDINGRLDDITGTKKLPEICFMTARLYTLGNYEASWVRAHPLSVGTGDTDLTVDSNGRVIRSNRFNTDTQYTTVSGHILGFTYHGDESTPIWERLKLSWACEVLDRSAQTGITMFDFDNDGIQEICYKDEVSVSVISPSLQNYVKKNSPTGGSNAIRFRKKDIYSYTAWEAPVIADVNMDGSADIVTMNYPLNRSVDPLDDFRSMSFVYVWEHAPGTERWASCPPVWNQCIYNPLYIREDLSVPSNPQPMLTQYVGPTGEIITPYNGQWKQQPIVDNSFPAGRTDYKLYKPIVRNPDAHINSMTIETPNSSTAIITMELQNRGEATINANTPITFYNGGKTCKSINDGAVKINTQQVGVDVFRDETVTLTFTLNGNFQECFVWARIMDDGTYFIAPGYYDCNLSNNTMSCGPLKLTNEPAMTTSCVGLESTFTVTIKNDQAVAFSDIQLVDSLGQEWQFVSATATSGTVVGEYNEANRTLTWSVPALHRGEEMVLTVVANAIKSGNNKHTVRVSAIDGLAVESNYMFANTQVYCNPLPTTPVITPTPANCCGVGNVTLNIPDAGVTYQWYRNNALIDNVSAHTYRTADRGSFYAVAFNGYCYSPMSNVVTLSVPTAYWSTTATDNNWNNPDNWVDSQGTQVNTVPAACTAVHIPGTSTEFPSLDSLSTPRLGYGDPRCDSIIFHFGAEVAKPHFLSYNKAFIQYNFGYYDANNSYLTDGDALAPVAMKRARWYALAAPLKKVVTGDFSFGGFPLTWQQGFKSARDYASGTLTGNWYYPENNVAMEIGERQNYAICLFFPVFKTETLGVNDQHHLNNLNGIVQLPYINDPVNGAEHPLHSYSQGVSRINYFIWGEGFPMVNEEYDEIERGNEAYRFVFEDENNRPQETFKVKIPIVDADEDNEIDEVMIGNPFVSSLDFSQFYAANNSEIESFYRLYNNGSFETKPLINSGLIAPLQAFFVKPVGEIGSETELEFTKDMSVTRTGAYQLRSAKHAADLDESVEGMIKITVANDNGSSYTSLVFKREGTKNVDWLYYNGRNPYTNYSNPKPTDPDHPEMPQIYSHDIFNNQRAIQYIIANGTSLEIPIGIHVRGASKGKYQLLFQSIGDLNPSELYLLDKLTGEKISPVNNNNSYLFNVEVEDDPDYLEERFVLLVGKNIFIGADLPSVETTSSISVYSNGNMLQVVSSGMNIKTVSVTAIQGVRMTLDTDINQPSFSRPLNIAPGIYLVTVKLENGEVKTTKIVVCGM
ncbi:MAG: DUF11 domain-containing protein [Dysgonamonadaceae bacterium]|nr:DUF11 domain-containing protein [Dysgonamonadaceae bacterium]